MGPSNKELRLRKNCQLYLYLLTALGKEIPEVLQECADSEDYDFLVESSSDLSREIENLDSENFEKIVNNQESQEARELSYWWKMHQEANQLGQKITKTCL